MLNICKSMNSFVVFFKNGVSKLVSANLRKEIVSFVGDPKLFNYLVILEANDNPYAV